MKYIPSENALTAREQHYNDSSKLLNHLSSQRKFQLDHFLKNNPKAFEIEQKYGKYLLVPLAVPLFEIPDKDHFMTWWEAHAIRPTKQKGDYVASDLGISPFESVDLLQEIGDDWNLNLQTESFKKEFPKLWQQFNDSFPCDKLYSINLWSSVQPFTEHRDSAEMVDFPASFRVKLYDENPEETLFVFDNPSNPYTCEEPTFLPRLPSTNTYVWNNLRTMHGSVYDQKYKKILAVVAGQVNLDRYDELLSRSTAIYKDNCLISKHSLENYVNI